MGGGLKGQGQAGLTMDGAGAECEAQGHKVLGAILHTTKTRHDGCRPSSGGRRKGVGRLRGRLQCSVTRISA